MPQRSVEDTSDATLVEAMRIGSEEAFVLLIDRHQAAMLRLARLYVGSQASAEDVVQETWMAVLRGVGRFDGRSSLRTWMYRILTNRAKTIGRRERRMIPVAGCPDDDTPEGGALRPTTAQSPATPTSPWLSDVDDRAVAGETAAAVASAINELSAAQRLVMTLRDVECWGAREVCQALDLSEANQRVLLHRARSKVRQQLVARSGEA